MKTTMFFQNAVVFMIVMTATSAQQYDYLCTRTTLIVGAGYNDHPTACDKYIQCHLDVHGNYVAEVRQCAFGTHWSMRLHTCLRSTKTSCKRDLCKHKADGKMREGVGNCRGYWLCSGGKSVSKCCPQGKYYNSVYEKCLNNTEEVNCTAKCFDDFNLGKTDASATITPEVPHVPFNCDKTAIPGNPSMYEQTVAGYGWKLTRPCSLGTEFVQQACNCVQSAINRFGGIATKQATTPDPWGVKMCKPSLYLPFSNDHGDVSGNNIYIGNENVVIENGVAKFNGRNSRLVIGQLSDFGVTDTLILKLKYTSNHEEISPNAPRALFSNDNCHLKPSVVMSENRDSVHSTLGTWAQFSISTDVPQMPLMPGQNKSEKVVVYKFNNAQFTSQLGNSTSTVPANGHFRTIRCPFHIGYADSMAPFKGEIDEVQLLLCNPTYM